MDVAGAAQSTVIESAPMADLDPDPGRHLDPGISSMDLDLDSHLLVPHDGSEAAESEVWLRPPQPPARSGYEESLRSFWNCQRRALLLYIQVSEISGG